MTEKPNSTLPDPGEMLRNMITEWERSFDTMANQFMGTPEYSKAMNQFQNAQLEMQQQLQQLMAMHLSHLNMPSRDDVLRLGEGLRKIEKRLSVIEMQLTKKSKKGKKNKDKGPPRTKQPPSQTSPGNA